MVPVKEFWYSHMRSILVNRPISVGIVPMRPQKVIDAEVKVLSVPISVGIVASTTVPSIHNSKIFGMPIMKLKSSSKKQLSK